MSKKKPIVTNAMRMLQAEKIGFETIEYEAEEVGENFGVHISELTGIPCEQSFKTLVARGKEIMVACIPVDEELDLKKLAKASGNKKVELIHVKELLGLTGYIRGGVSPIGMKKKYPTYIHQSCRNFDKIAVSAGICGATLLMNPDDLLRVIEAEMYDIIKDK
ncbi:MAG: Cys-tRNA(Pro) deacylase [Firmicutes bacterium]|nr:Cys-tRNA(Pro) deacylase [Bacillota bacterium]